MDFNASRMDVEFNKSQILNELEKKTLDEFILLEKLQESHELDGIQYATIHFGRGGGNRIKLCIGNNYILAYGYLRNLKNMVDIGIGVNKCITSYITGRGENIETMYQRFYNIVIVLDCDLLAIEYVMNDVIHFSSMMVMDFGSDVMNELYEALSELFENEEMWIPTKLKKHSKRKEPYSSKRKEPYRSKRKEPYQRRIY